VSCYRGESKSSPIEKNIRYYDDLHYRSPAVPSDELTTAALMIEEDSYINCTAPSKPKVALRVKKLENVKMPGICGITAELLRNGGLSMIS